MFLESQDFYFNIPTIINMYGERATPWILGVSNILVNLNGLQSRNYKYY